MKVYGQVDYTDVYHGNTMSMYQSLAKHGTQEFVETIFLCLDKWSTNILFAN